MSRSTSVILFDFGGTLDAAGVTWKDRVFSLYRREGVDVASDRFDPVFYRADDGLVGTIAPTLSFAETVRQLVARVSAGLGVADDRLTARVAERFIGAARVAVAANAPLLSRLARDYRLGVVSNFYGNLETVCDDLGLRPLFRAIIDSACVGCTKPDPRIFQSALAAVGAEASAATFVGDSPSRDMVGARDVGMPHVWLVPSGDHAPPCCPNDPVVRSLDELPGVLA